MTTVERGAYLAALERKLVEAEMAIKGFRAIWNKMTEVQEPEPKEYLKEPECIE